MHEHDTDAQDADNTRSIENEPPHQHQQLASGYTDFEGRARSLTSSDATLASASSSSALTRPLPAPPLPPSSPPAPAHRRGGRLASLAIVLALIVGLLAGGVGGYALGNRGDNPVASTASASNAPVVA